MTVPGWSKAFPFCDGCKDLGRKQPVYRQKHAPDEAAREAAAGKKAARKRAVEGAAKAAAGDAAGYQALIDAVERGTA